MKKTATFLFAVCMCFCVGFSSISCGHEHTYQSEWSKDATYHWHACNGDDCNEVSEKAEHTWNDGAVTTPATAEADGVKTFTCTVCGQTKTESVEYLAIPSQTEWTAAFNATLNANNLTFSREQLVNGVSDGVQTVYKDHEKIFMQHTHPYNTVHDCYFYYGNDDKIYHYTNSNGEGWEREETSGILHTPALSDTMMPFEALYDSFDFDEQTATFVIEETTALGLKMVDVQVKIENGYVSYLTYTMAYDPSMDIDSVYKMILIFSQYGTTEVSLPALNQ